MYWWNYGGCYLPRSPGFGDSLPEASLEYWTRSLFQRMTALINIENVPGAPEQLYTWDVDALKYQLFMLGFAAVFESKTYGKVPQPATLTGYGLQYQPTGAMIKSPYFQFTEPLRIGDQCELIKLTPDYTGIFDIVAKYANELKEIDITIKSAARNVRLGYAMVADSDRTARTLKGIREKILNGEDAIVDEKLVKRNPEGSTELPWYLFDRDVKQSYILNDLLEARRDTLVDFYREIGVKMLDNKKERMITSEVDSAQAETFIRSEVWAETLKISVDKVNKHFGTSIKITINEPDVLREPEGGDPDAGE